MSYRICCSIIWRSVHKIKAFIHIKIYDENLIVIISGHRIGNRILDPLKMENNKTDFNPFTTDGTQKYRFEKFIFFIWKRMGALIPMSDASMRRYCRTSIIIVGQTQKSTKKTITVAKGLIIIIDKWYIRFIIDSQLATRNCKWKKNIKFPRLKNFLWGEQYNGRKTVTRKRSD